MRRGTTPTLNISIDYVSTDIARAWISFAQGGTVIINKELTDDGVTIEDVTENEGLQNEYTHAIIHITFSQDDTLSLVPGPLELQVRALMDDDKAAASSIYKLNVAKILKDGVITLEA